MRIGAILKQDFGWPSETISQAKKAQDESDESRLIGEFLRAAAPPGREYEVALALLLQGDQGGVRSDAFHLLEYSELGSLYRFERVEVAKKIRAYWLTVLGLYVFVAYPIYAGLGWMSDSKDMQSIADAIQWLSLMYGFLGLFLCMFTLFLGNSTLLDYAHYLKRRMRLSKARIEIRGLLTGSIAGVMPRRMPTGDERHDPGFSGREKALPLYYLLWSISIALFFWLFVAVVVGESINIDIGDVELAILITLALFPGWIHLAAGACESYHKCLKEAVAIRADSPFPRYKTSHLREDERYRGRTKLWSFINYTLAGIPLACCLWWIFNDKPLGSVVTAAFSCIVIGFVRVMHVLYRVDHMERMDRSDGS